MSRRQSPPDGTSQLPSPSEQQISDHIRRHYSHLYEHKLACRLNLPTGKTLAAQLGYPESLLDSIPDALWDDFFPCGNPLVELHPNSGQRILNLGCGAAIDSLILHLEWGNSLQIINLDIVNPILSTGRRHAAQAFPSVLSCCYWVNGDGLHLPFRHSTFDWVILNGVLNLFPDKVSLLHEVRRVLSPSGALVGADLCSALELDNHFHAELDAWAWCMSGAFSPEALVTFFHSVGFIEVRIRHEESGHPFHRVAFRCDNAATALP